MDSTSGIRYGPEIAAAARSHGLDPTLLAAVAAQETGGPGSNSGRNVVGDGGHGHGLFQIDDRYQAFARSGDAMDPAKNANYAAGMLQDLMQRNGGDVHAALSAYNTGSPDATGTVTDWGGGVHLGYADSVMRHYAALSQAAGAATVAVSPQPLQQLDAGAMLDQPTSVSSQYTQLQALATQVAAGAAPTIQYTPPPKTQSQDQNPIQQQAAAAQREADAALASIDNTDDDAA